MFSKKTTIVCAAVAALSFGMVASNATATVVYDSLPTVPPGDFNVVSEAYQATQNSEFGDNVTLAGTDRQLTTITIGMSDWAKLNDASNTNYATNSQDGTTWTHPLTLNIYNVDHSDPNTPAVGGLIASKTVTSTIPYRPENYTANGIYFTTSFDFTADNITLPDEVLVTLAFNTQTYGANPIGTAGPYNSLNFGLNEVSGPSIGSTDTDSLFWNTATAAWYADNGAGGTGTLRYDTGWSPYNPAMQINAVPEPSSLAIFLGLGGLALLSRRTRRKVA